MAYVTVCVALFSEYARREHHRVFTPLLIGLLLSTWLIFQLNEPLRNVTFELDELEEYYTLSYIEN